jgi:hypothetical protein
VGGTFAVNLQGNDLVLQFTPVPEPALALALAVAVGAVWRRRLFTSPARS